MSRPALLFCAAAALSASCKRAPPRYCDQDLSGVWVNASDPAYAYRLEDRGDSVRGRFFRREADGGEVAPEPGDDPMLIDLRRTDKALAGTMTTKGEAPGSKRRCDLAFTARVSTCQPDALQVIAETSYDVREDCTRQKEEDGGVVPPRLTEHRWERPVSPGAAKSR